MTTYTITAACRKAGALGIGRQRTFDVQADNVEAARDAAYETHEHFAGGRIFDNVTQHSYDFFTLTRVA